MPMHPMPQAQRRPHSPLAHPQHLPRNLVLPSSSFFSFSFFFIPSSPDREEEGGGEKNRFPKDPPLLFRILRQRSALPRLLPNVRLAPDVPERRGAGRGGDRDGEPGRGRACGRGVGEGERGALLVYGAGGRGDGFGGREALEGRGGE